MGPSASFGGVVRVRDRVWQREIYRSKPRPKAIPTDTLGDGQISEDFSQTMKPTSTNELSPKMLIGKWINRTGIAPQSFKSCDCTDWFCPKKGWHQPLHCQQLEHILSTHDQDSGQDRWCVLSSPTTRNVLLIYCFPKKCLVYTNPGSWNWS